MLKQVRGTWHAVKSGDEPFRPSQMRRKQQEYEWMRQHDIVVRDTPSYETSFWRNIISGKRRFSGVQLVGLGIVYGAVAFLLWWMLRGIVSSPIVGCLLLRGYGALFFLLRWRTRTALSRTAPHSTNTNVN